MSDKRNMQQVYEELQRMREERYNDLLGMVKEKHPNVDYDNVATRMDDDELRVYLNNTRYLIAKSYPRYVGECRTDFGVMLEMAIDDKKGYSVQETSTYELALITPFLDDEVKVQHFNKVTGCRRKNRRRFIKVHKSGKGRYIVIRRARYYLPDKWWNY